MRVSRSSTVFYALNSRWRGGPCESGVIYAYKLYMLMPPQGAVLSAVVVPELQPQINQTPRCRPGWARCRGQTIEYHIIAALLYRATPSVIIKEYYTSSKRVHLLAVASFDEHESGGRYIFCPAETQRWLNSSSLPVLSTCSRHRPP